jgi:hypothetical protein
MSLETIEMTDLLNVIRNNRNDRIAKCHSFNNSVISIVSNDI